MGPTAGSSIKPISWVDIPGQENRTPDAVTLAQVAEYGSKGKRKGKGNGRMRNVVRKERAQKERNEKDREEKQIIWPMLLVFRYLVKMGKFTSSSKRFEWPGRTNVGAPLNPFLDAP